jgi:2-octaprenyl-6-methoxyphenol hydroxylase
MSTRGRSESRAALRTAPGSPVSTVLIVGGGPVGLALALLLARRAVPSTVVDARTLDAAAADRRLLALSRGTLDLLQPLVRLPAAATSPIRSVVVSSAGEFGRVVIGPEDLGPQPLGLTVRYGDLLQPLAQACADEPLIRLRRPLRVAAIEQKPAQAVARFDDGSEEAAAVLVNAEGTARDPAAPTQAALVADVRVQGPAAGTAFERFTREGPCALLPLPGAASEQGRPMALVWCMPVAAAERRAQLDDAAFIAELHAVFGTLAARIVAVGPRAPYPLHQQSRALLREHRCVWIGNAAQTLHPVAGQGLNLGMRDAAQLADTLAQAITHGADPLPALDAYEQARRADRAAVLTLTRRLPGLFATRAAPVALGRTLGLLALVAIPDLRREFARLLMFGVRA